VTDIRDWLYWAWVGLVALATIWGGFLERFDIGFFWSVVGGVALLLIVILLRWADRRRALSASTDPDVKQR
jgi:hypothetical protein